MNEILRQLPKIDRLINAAKLEHIPENFRKCLAIKYVEIARNSILSGTLNTIDEQKIIDDILVEFQKVANGSIKNVINATGITIHTNLGRSPLSKDMLEKVIQKAAAYCNLEYNLAEGKRGDRYHHLDAIGEYLFCGYEVLLVNNNAAAVFLVLNTFAKGREAVVSRGELVEIGGGFRIPDVMANSGAILQEVGTTNKTRLSDYKNAISDETALLMKVHQSNFSIEGFSEEVSLQELASFAKNIQKISYYDLGSGLIEPFGSSKKEHTVSEVCTFGLDIISFSMDKLVGSIQGGIILAKKEHMKALKENQLLRMLRADKLTIAITEECLLSYLLNEPQKITAYAMLNASVDELREKAAKICKLLNSKVMYDKILTSTYAGGGSMPNDSFASFAIALSFNKPVKLEKYLRQNSIITRIENDFVLLDVRTLFEEDFNFIAEVINKFYEEQK
ncbi:MAG: selenocysteine synthase [Pseudomonadota bacterium]|jgi:L-seryl-tRNA(Ser) seleniumtransferase